MKAAMDEGKGKEKASDFTDFIDGLKDSDLKDLRNWKNEVREILNKTPKKFLTSDFTNTLRVMNEWDRKGTVKSLSDEKSFKKDIARNVQNRQQAVAAFEKFFNEIFEDKTQMSIAMLARTMIQSLKAEAKWWADFKQEGESKIK
jgi:tetrahydromethanopterin S-methyltransferase subunit A